MITEKDLLEAIAECEGIRHPGANVCIKLAAFYIIYDHMFGRVDESPQYSLASGHVESNVADIIPYISDSDFSQAIEGRGTVQIMEVMDDLMSTLQVVNPRLYASVMRKIQDG